MINFIVFFLFFAKDFQDYVQNISDTEWSHQLLCKNTAIVFSAYCFSWEVDETPERLFFMRKNKKSNPEFKKDFENHVESLFLSFEEWKNRESLDVIDNNEVIDSKIIKNSFMNSNNETLFHDFKKIDHQTHVDNDIKNQESRIGNQVNVSDENYIYNLTNNDDNFKILPKERFNYASIDCAATVLKANTEAKGIAFILSSNKDLYMLNKCSAPNKFVIVELCNDILIDTIVLGNLEFFSSTFKDFRISVSDRYPVKKSSWKELGTFTAMNVKDIQTFTITNSLWAKYLRIDFLTHYGNKFYCPITLLRVHGTTMIEEYKYENEFKNTQINDKVSFKSDDLKDSFTESNFGKHSLKKQGTDYYNNETSETLFSLPYHFVNTLIPVNDIIQISDENNDQYLESCPLYFFSTLEKVSLNEYNYETSALFKDPVCSVLNNYTNQELKMESGEVNLPSVSLISIVSTELFLKPTLTAESFDNFSSIQFNSNNISKKEIKTQTIQNSRQSLFLNTEDIPMQKNIYKSISKRLSFLEINTTLYLQYIEQQSKLLKNIFIGMEKKHEDKMDFVIQTLNSTLLSRLDIFRHQYEELWQIITIEIEHQRAKLKKDISTITSRMEYLSNEVLIQRWIIVFQFLILFGIFIFFIFK
ncbi:hypothetical protein PORY_000421 [Pneumocystis oryctolagi]|uniref:Uncharacterized protein n=1 Tax=Pneumocystis oryctolagi TaxID=42067 RepID=A0ACB7CFN9_9ASCO|nr:hypothetical protein PORY_000421 [Pneumocystis oryctolagi]